MSAVVKLGDVAALIRGVTYDKLAAISEPRQGYTPILRAGNISDVLNIKDGLIWIPRNAISSDQMLRSGDIVMCASSGSSEVVGKSAQIFESWIGSFGAFCLVVRAKTDRCIPDYLAHYLRSPVFRAWSRGASGANIKNIRQSELAEFCMPLPPLDEQRRIVDILNRAERIRRLRDAATATRRALIPALFLKMFGDPIENPMGWDVRPLGEALRACDYGSSTKASETGEGLPLIRMANVDIQGHLDTGDLKYVELSEADNTKYGVEAGDIIFNRTNSKELVGKTGLWDGRFPAVLASYFIRLRVKTDIVAPVFVWAYFNTPAMKKKLYATARGAIGQANINAKELSAFALPLPPLEKQRQFGDLVEGIITGGAMADTAATTATALAAALTSRLFGEAA